VTNLSDAIKIASDFVSMDNLHRTHYLVGEFRKQRLATSWGDDVLAFYSTLWYAWISVSRLNMTVSFDEPMHSPGEEMLVDVAPSPSAQPAMSADNGNDVIIPINDAFVPTVYDANGNGHTPDSEHKLTKQQARNKERRKMKRAARKLEGRAPKDGHIYPCPSPICQRKLNRLGYFDHM
jgi:hypothetical protein